jgi:hypothetical protein
LRFALFDRADGVEPEEGTRVVYDVGRGEAWLGATGVDGHALVWELGGNGDGAALAVGVDLDPSVDWLARCDRVDFPPGSVAHRHVHPGPGIRYLLFGALQIERPGGGAQTIEPGEAWFEDADDPVRAVASETMDTAFVRVLLLPREWAGRRTIRYLDPADEEKPKLQQVRLLLEEPIERVA